MSADWVAVERVIQTALDSDVPLVNQVCQYILAKPGKRLRPTLVLLVSQALGLQDHRRFELAAIVEFIHTATLLHDDVVDESTLRRGRATVNAQFGNAASVLVGDFLYSRSFQMMVRLDAQRIMSILADTTNVIAGGEVLQLAHVGDPHVSQATYLKVISSKTAQLFEACARLPCVLAKIEPHVEEALATYGRALGVAFQIVDDVLDYGGDLAHIGKNLGDDLREGKVTLPLILAMERASVSQREILRGVIQSGGHTDMSLVMSIIEQTQALEGAMELARAQLVCAIHALSSLPENAQTQELAKLAQHAVDRRA